MILLAQQTQHAGDQKIISGPCILREVDNKLSSLHGAHKRQINGHILRKLVSPHLLYTLGIWSPMFHFYIYIYILFVCRLIKLFIYLMTNLWEADTGTRYFVWEMIIMQVLNTIGTIHN